MSVQVSRISANQVLLRIVGEASVDVFSVDETTQKTSSAYLTAAMLRELDGRIRRIVDVVPSADKLLVLQNMLPRILSVSSVSVIAALDVTVVDGGPTSTLRVQGLTSPQYVLVTVPHSLSGGFDTSLGIIVGGGGGGGGGGGDGGVVDPPTGSGPFPVGTPVAIVAGLAVAADAASESYMPAVGVWTADNKIRTDGLLTGLSGLTANVPYFVASGSGLASSPPNTAGTVEQRVGTSIGTTALFVSIRNEIYN